MTLGMEAAGAANARSPAAAIDDVRLPADLARTITEPSAFADPARIDRLFAWIRANNPLGRAEVEGFAPFWVASKHADVVAVGRDSKTFSSTGGPTMLTETAVAERMRALNPENPNPFISIAFMDEPEHMTHRLLFADWFLPKNVEARAERVRAIARSYVDRMAEKGGACEFVNDIAVHYPRSVMMEILGVPPDGEKVMITLTDELFNDQDPETSAHGAVLSGEAAAEKKRQTFDSMVGYFTALTEARAREPRDDIATVIAQARVNGRPLTVDEAFGHYTSFATAGHHTAASTLAGGIWFLCERPELLAQLKADPALVVPFVEETLRRLCPAKHFLRRATRDVELRGRTIRENEWVYMSFVSANHDEDVFEDPFTFRLDRRINRHLSFGFGPHVCVGQSLARAELRIFFEELIPRLSELGFAAQPSMLHARWVQGPKHMPLAYRLS
jgi:cytochrome P450